MAYPFFSLSKTHRVAPIDFVSGAVSIRVEAVPDHGMATMWDADILIWAASQIVEARDRVIGAFRDDPGIMVFLISLKAGGVALNLTSASRIFLMDPW